MIDLRIRFKPQPISGHRSGLRHNNYLPNTKVIFIVIACVVIAVIGIIFLYNYQLTPIDKNDLQLKKIIITTGSNSSQIGDQLEEQSIIRSAFIFDIFTRLSGKNSLLQAGNYRLSPSESLPQIVDHLVNGKVDQFSITFYPGSTLVDNSNKSEDKKQDVTTILKRAGYSTTEISSAFQVLSIGSLFADKPLGMGLEGYIYGETYSFSSGATVDEILQTVFDEFENVIKDEDLVNKFAAKGLNLYEGITLASIVQRESGNARDQQQIAQVFYSRLNQGMTLGSDVTYQYIADRDGLARDTNLNSPYNTRRFVGLPPGPISNPGLSALRAVADPAPGSYLYFVSDSSGKLYFANTEAEHQFNIVNYCKDNCVNP